MLRHNVKLIRIPRTTKQKRKLTTEQKNKICTVEINNERNFRLSISTEYGIKKSQPALHGQREQECF